MEVLITSKTHKGKAACVGGLVLADNRFVRLLNPGNWDQYSDTNFDVGDVWDIKFSDREDKIPPHNEDVIIGSKNYLRKMDKISEHIKSTGITIYQGAPQQIFDGFIEWSTSGSGSIRDKEKLPNSSVGFWISDKDLTLDTDGKHYTYKGKFLFDRNRLPYVGYEPPIDIIPSGTLIRVSLARWWKPKDVEIEERCYLQLSGWYDLSGTRKSVNKNPDDLPF